MVSLTCSPVARYFDVTIRHVTIGLVPRKPRKTLTIDLPVAASPARVAEVATMLQRAIEAADDALSENSVTLVVKNHALHAELRGLDQRGAKAVAMVDDVVMDATAAVRKRPQARRIASAIAKHGARLARLNPAIRGSGGKANLDSAAIDALRGLGEGTGASRRVAGTTLVYSKVIRLGRGEESAAVAARIEVQGRYLDVPIEDGLVSAFVEALEIGDLRRITLRVEWVSENDDGRAVADPRSIRAIAVSPFAPISGAELMERVQIDEAAVSAFLEQSELDA